MQFKWRIIIPVATALLLGIVVFMSIVSVIFYNAVYEASRDEALQLAKRYATASNTIATSSVATAHSVATLLETEVVQKYTDRDIWLTAMNGVVKDNPSTVGLAIHFQPNAYDGLDEEFRGTASHDNTGVFSPYLRSTNTGSTLTAVSAAEYQQKGWYTVMQGSTARVADPVLVGRAVSTMIMVPIRPYTTTIGFVAAETTFEGMQAKIAHGTIGHYPDAFALLLSSNGFIVNHTSSDYIGRNLVDLGLPVLETAVQQVIRTGRPMIAEAYSASAGEICYFALTPVEIVPGTAPWVMSVGIPRSNIMAPIYTSILSSVAIVAVVVIVTMGLLYTLVSRSGNTLSHMNDRLNTTIQSISSAASEISGSADVLAQGSVEQAASIEESSATSIQAAALVQDTTDSTKTIAGLSADALEAAQEGLARVEDLTTSMQELATSSAEIAKIISIIENIAFQTNILALNASVEAARVGDAGRGFNVVAEEVRNLASRSTEAAANTTAIVEHKLQLSRQGVTGASEVKAALGEIVATNTKVNNLVMLVDAAGQEQLVGINQINIALAQMEDVTQSNAAVAEENAASAAVLETQSKELASIQSRLNALIKGSGATQQHDDFDRSRPTYPNRNTTRSSQSRQRSPVAPPPPRNLSTNSRTHLITPNDRLE